MSDTLTVEVGSPEILVITENNVAAELITLIDTNPTIEVMAAGNMGVPGPKGDQGIQGPVGGQGIKGDKGDKGDTGATGPQGPIGNTGATGATGPQGVKGDTGSQGPIGNTGPQGPVGATGADSTVPGPVGPKGDKGDKGDTGTTGATGSQGPQGNTGPTGATGSQGPQGNPGATGATGTAATATAGTTATLAPGANATVVNAGTTSAAVFNFGIPTGAQGPQGIQGIPGPAGSGSGDVVSTTTLTAGAGLTGGGNLSASRTFDVGAGTGITVAADTVAVDTAVIAAKSYVDTQDAAHVAAPDPHPQYSTDADLNGYAANHYNATEPHPASSYMKTRQASVNGWNETQEGQWVVGPTYPGTPPPGGQGWWIMEIINYAPDWTIQRAYSPFTFGNSPEVWERGKETTTGQTFTAWRHSEARWFLDKHVAAADPHPQYLTDAELAAALPPESDAAFNTNYGVGAMPTPGTANGATAIGSAALNLATSGNSTAVGRQALGNKTAFNDCTAVGAQAGYNATGGGLTLIGHGAGYYPNVVTGNNGTYIGCLSSPYAPGQGIGGTGVGSYSRTNTNASSLGYQAEARGVKSVAIGQGAIATLDNQIMLGTATETVYAPNKVKIGAGTGVPTSVLEVHGPGNTSAFALVYDAQPAEYRNTIKSYFHGNPASNVMDFVLRHNSTDHLVMQLRADDKIIYNGNPVFMGDVGVNLGLTATPLAALHAQTKDGTNDNANIAMSYGGDPSYRAMIRGTWSGAGLPSNWMRFTMRTGLDGIERTVWTAIGDGSMTVAADPTVALGVATKQYVDGRTPTLPPETDANGNTGYGINTLISLTTGTANTSIGQWALSSVTEGSNNVAVGDSAGRFLTTGTNNIVMGNRALATATNGQGNLGFGAYALESAIGDYNVAIGFAAAQTAGSGCVAIGAWAGIYGAGNPNDALSFGYNAQASNGGVAIGALAQARGNHSTAIGFNSVATLDDQIMLGTAAEKVYAPGGLYAQTDLAVGLVYSGAYAGIQRLPVGASGSSGNAILLGSAGDNQMYLMSAVGSNIYIRPSYSGASQWTWTTADCLASTPLTLPADPTTALHAATKQYVDNKVATVDLSTKVSKTGDTMTGNLVFSAAASAWSYIRFAEGSNRRWEIGKSVDWAHLDFMRYNGSGTYVDTPVSINSATGELSVTKPLWLTDPVPVYSNNAASKAYVDGRVVVGGAKPSSPAVGTIWVPAG